MMRDITIAWVEPVVDKKADGTPIAPPAVDRGCPASIDAPAGVRCYTQRFVL
jgi:hypothetical protein